MRSIAEGSGAALFCSSGKLLDRYSAHTLLEGIISQLLAIGVDQSGNAVENICRERIHISLPSSNAKTECAIQHMIAEFIIDGWEK